MVNMKYTMTLTVFCSALVIFISSILTGCLLHEFPGTHHPGSLSVVCLRYVAGDGLRGRTVSFASNRVPDFAGSLRYSHRGPCVIGSQGPSQSYAVCLPGASACSGPQTRSIFPDEFDTYRSIYRNLRFGACEVEALDKCLDADQFNPIPKPLGCPPWDKKCVDGSLKR